MTIDFFKGKFQHKTNKELEEIVMSNIKYVIDARIAALELLKLNGFSSPIIGNIDVELEKLKNEISSELINSKNKQENIIKNLKNIRIKTTKKLTLEYGNELQVKRINDELFQIRIEHSKSFICPVIRCRIIDNEKIEYFPFPYFRSIVTFIIISVLIIFYFIIRHNTIPEVILFVFGLLPIGNLITQLLMTPSTYPFILKTFKVKFEISNVS